MCRTNGGWTGDGDWRVAKWRKVSIMHGFPNVLKCILCLESLLCVLCDCKWVVWWVCGEYFCCKCFYDIACKMEKHVWQAIVLMIWKSRFKVSLFKWND